MSKLSDYRGACLGLLAGGPVGLATSASMSLAEPSMIVTAIAGFWLAGCLCGHTMQSLLES